MITTKTQLLDGAFVDNQSETGDAGSELGSEALQQTSRDAGKYVTWSQNFPFCGAGRAELNNKT